MSDGMSMKVVGADVLITRLRDMSIQVEQKLGIQALRAGAVIVRKDIAAKLPRTDLPSFKVKGRSYPREHLHKDLTIFRPRLVSRRGKVRGGRATRGQLVGVMVRLGYKSQGRFYGHIIEYGNSRIRPNAVWRRAAQSNLNRVVPVVAEKLYKDLAKEIRRSG